MLVRLDFLPLEVQVSVVSIHPFCLVNVEVASRLRLHRLALQHSVCVIEHLHVDMNYIRLQLLVILRLGVDSVDLRVAREREVLEVVLGIKF